MEDFQRKLSFVVFVLLLHLGGVYVLSSEAQIYGLDAVHSIPDEYIIVHKTPNSKTKASNLMSSLQLKDNVTVQGDYNIGSERLTFVKGPLKVIQSLRHLSEVAFIEANQRVSYHDMDFDFMQLDEFGNETDDSSTASITQTTDAPHICYTQPTGDDLWGLSRINTRQKPESYPGLEFTFRDDELGTGVDVYVVDTGVYTGHDDLRDRAVWGFTASSVIAEGNDDKDGHGTHVAGIAAGTKHGVAKQANIISAKVLNGEGLGTVGGIIEALGWISQKETAKQIQGKGGRTVVNLSLGTRTVSHSLDSSLQGLIEQGIPAVVAAGNDYSDACYSSPANVVSAITVGATDRSDKIAAFSNYGLCVDVMAPGERILSSYIGSPSSLAVLRGTSQATPHVTGVLASYLSSLPDHTKPTPAELKDYLVAMATTGAIEYEYHWEESTPDRLLYKESCESPAQPYTTIITSTTQTIAPTTSVYEENTTPTTTVYEENASTSLTADAVLCSALSLLCYFFL